jgi:hypothetical protein
MCAARRLLTSSVVRQRFPLPFDLFRAELDADTSSFPFGFVCFGFPEHTSVFLPLTRSTSCLSCLAILSPPLPRPMGKADLCLSNVHVSFRYVCISCSIRLAGLSPPLPRPTVEADLYFLSVRVSFRYASTSHSSHLAGISPDSPLLPRPTDEADVCFSVI